jgi:alpha-glucosidase
MPWSYPDIMPSVRKAFALRKRLIPYLYNCAYEAVEKALPVNAPVWLYYGDSELGIDSDAFMLGRKILVCCILDEGETETEVFLPRENGWYMGDRYLDGGKSVRVTVLPENEVPFFIKAGCVLPTDEAEYGFKCGENEVLTVYPLSSGEFEDEFFTDDGLTCEYKNNNCVKLKINVVCETDAVRVSYENLGNTDYSPQFKLCAGDRRELVIER